MFGDGHCTLCGRPAEATADNQGYSPCCNDRICHSTACSCPRRNR